MAPSAGEHPITDLMWTMLVFFGWVIWSGMLVVIFVDLRHRSDVSGWRKAAWTVLLVPLPLVGVLTYLIARNASASVVPRTTTRTD